MINIMHVENITKSFGDVEAVRGIDFGIPEGSCFGLLGPNGAGKTTTIEIMEGIQTPSTGKVILKSTDCVPFSGENLLNSGHSPPREVENCAPDHPHPTA